MISGKRTSRHDRTNQCDFMRIDVNSQGSATVFGLESDDRTLQPLECMVPILPGGMVHVHPMLRLSADVPCIYPDVQDIPYLETNPYVGNQRHYQKREKQHDKDWKLCTIRDVRKYTSLASPSASLSDWSLLAWAPEGPRTAPAKPFRIEPMENNACLRSTCIYETNRTEAGEICTQESLVHDIDVAKYDTQS